MSVHTNSLDAYYQGKLDVFPRRSVEVLRALSTLGMASDRDVCEHLGFADMNCVRPRITELIKEGVLQEMGTQVDPVTRRHVRVVRIVPYNDPAQLDLKLEVA